MSPKGRNRNRNFQTIPFPMFNRIRKFFAKPSNNLSRAMVSKDTSVERKTVVVSKKHDPKEVKP